MTQPARKERPDIPRCSACGTPYSRNSEGAYEWPCLLCVRLFDFDAPWRATIWFDDDEDGDTAPAEPQEASQ